MPTVLVQRTVLHRSHRILPVIASRQVGTLHDTTTREAEDARLQVGQRLSQIFAQAILTSLPSIYREERHMLQIHCLTPLEEHPHRSFLYGYRRFYHHLIFLPFLRINRHPLGCKRLSFSIGIGVAQLYPDLHRLIVLRQSGPHREAIVLTLFQSHTEGTTVLHHGKLVLVTRISHSHIVRVALKRTVIAYLHIAHRLPSIQLLRKLKRAVQYQFGIQATIGSKVDILEKQAVHRILYGSPHLLHLHGHLVRLCLYGHCRHHRTNRCYRQKFSHKTSVFINSMNKCKQ